MKPYWGKPAVRDFRGSGGNVGIIRSPVRATALPGNGTTNGSGIALTTLQVRNLAGDVRVSACIAPNNNPCATFYVSRVLLSSLGMLIVSGNSQMVSVGQAFQPVVVRVTDASSPPNPVQGASVKFWSVVFRPDYDVIDEPIGETGGVPRPCLSF